MVELFKREPVGQGSRKLSVKLHAHNGLLLLGKYKARALRFLDLGRVAVTDRDTESGIVLELPVCVVKDIGIDRRVFQQGGAKGLSEIHIVYRRSDYFFTREPKAD